MTEYQATPPPAFAKIAMVAGAKLIRTERATVTALRAVTKAAVRQVAEAQGPRNAHKAIAQAATELRTNAARVVLDARTTARALAAAQLAAEVKAATAAMGIPLFHVERADASADPGLAAASGEAIASAFRLAMHVATSRAASPFSDGDRTTEAPSAPPDLNAAAKPLDARLRRVATVEVFRANNEEHREGLVEVSKNHEADPHGLLFMARRWDAIRDRVTCPVCRKHDGEVVAFLPGTIPRFSRGDEPSELHFCCRCSSTLTVVPIHRVAA